MTAADRSHLDLDAVADLLAGEGTPADAAHLAGCDRCGSLRAELSAALVPLTADLADLAGRPLPPVPADLETRLLAALGPGAADVVPLRSRAARPHRRGAGLLRVAAGGVALVALVGLGVGLSGGGLSGGGFGGAGSDSGAADSAQAGADGSGGGLAAADLPTSATGTDYGPDPRLFALALPGLLRGEPGGQQRVAAEASASDTDSDSDSGAGPADAGIPQTVPPQAVAPAPVAPAPTGDDPLARLREPAALEACLAALTDVLPGPDDVPRLPAAPLALDYATFDGAPALVVVLAATRPDAVDVYAVGPGCRPGADGTLFFARLPRP